MKKLILLFILVPSLLLAQKETEEKKDSLLYQWVPRGIATFNLSQIAFTDWSQGGENALTYTLIGDFGLNYKTEDWNFKNDMKLTYGQTKIEDEVFKINNNEVYMENVLSKRIGWVVDPYISNTLQTVLATGWKYSEDEGDRPIAKFFDPGYLTQSIGFTYNENDIIKTRAGLAVKETFTDEFPQYADDPETAEVETFRFETGVESVTDLQFDVAKNLLYKSKLRLFSAFEHLDVWDVRWDNTIGAKVNDFLVVNFNVLLIYEKRQSLRTQIKQALQIGITYTIF